MASAGEHGQEPSAKRTKAASSSSSATSHAAGVAADASIMTEASTPSAQGAAADSAPSRFVLPVLGGATVNLTLEEIPQGSLQVPQETGSAFPNVRGYAEKKAGAALKSLEVELKEGLPVPALDRKRIVVVGCPIQQPTLLQDILRRVLPEHAQSVNLAHFQELEGRVAEHASDHKTRKEARKPVGLWIGDVGVVVTCPSRGNVRVYASSLREVLPRVDVKAFLVPEIANDSAVFMAVYGLAEDAAFKATMENAVVVVGAGFDGTGGAPMQDAVAQECAERPTEASGKWWRAKIYRPSRMGIAGAEKVVFLDWYPSFWGEIAYAFGLTLYEAGAVEVLHLGSKVGSMQRQLVGALCRPTGFVEVNEYGQRKPVADVNHAFSDVTVPGLQCIRTHASAPNAFDEIKFSVLQMSAAEGAQTVDDEGAHYARAAAKARKPFDAVYPVSDHVWVDNDGSDVSLTLSDGLAKVENDNETKARHRQQQLRQVGGLLAQHILLGQYTPVVITASVASEEINFTIMRKLEMFIPGTREWVFTGLSDRLKSKRGIVLLAHPGAGKSVVMAEFARRGSAHLRDAFLRKHQDSAMKLGDVAGSPRVPGFHFFEYGDEEAAGVKACLVSLARQLASAGLMAFPVDAEQKLCKEASAQALIQELLLKPLGTSNYQHPSAAPKMALVVDAIDECERCAELSHALAKAWGSRGTAPAWLGLVVSTRRLNADHTILTAPAALGEGFLMDTASKENKEDLDKAVRALLAEFPDLLQRDAIVVKVLERATNLFLWLEYQRDALTELAREKKLDVDAVEKLPHGLQEVYSKYFGMLYDKLGGDEGKAKYKLVVALGLLAPRAHISEVVWRRAVKRCLPEMDDIQTFDEKVLMPCKALLIIENDVVRAPHKTMLDWVEYKERKQEEQVEYREPRAQDAPGTVGLSVLVENGHHHALAALLHEIYSGIPLRKTWARELDLSKDERFAVAHAAYHRLKGGELEEAVKWFAEFPRLYWMVAVGVADAGAAGVARVVGDGDAVEDALRDAGKMEDAKTVRVAAGAVGLASEAVQRDPRQLAGQVMGRCGARKCRDKVRPAYADRVAKGAEEWVAQATKAEKDCGGGLRVLVPVDGRAGLELAAGKLRKVLIGHTSDVKAVAVTPDGKQVITGSKDNTARVWDIETGVELLKMEGHTGEVRAVAVTPDGKRVVTGSHDKTARVWDLETGVELLAFKGHSDWVYAVAVTPDGKRVVTSSEDNTARVWDVETGKELLKVEGHKDKVWAVAVTPDGKRVVTGSRDRTARVWDMETGVELLKLDGHTDWVKGVAVTPDGKRAVTASVDRTARVWDMETGVELLKFVGHLDVVWAVAVTPNGKLVVTGSHDTTARLWDMESGAELLKFEGHIDWVKTVAVTPDGRRAVTGSVDRTAREWNLETGVELLKLEGHTDDVRVVAVTPDGKRVVTGSNDETARVWDMETGVELLKLEGHTDGVRAVVVTPVNKCLVTGSDDGTARVWDMETGTELSSHACGEFRLLAVGVDDNTAALMASPVRRVEWGFEVDGTDRRGVGVSLFLGIRGNEFMRIRGTSAFFVEANEKDVAFWTLRGGG